MTTFSEIFQGGFDANAVEPDTGRDFEPLPAGAYDVEITNAEVKDNKAGTGCYLSLELTVMGPTGAGRKVWTIINLRNASQQAEQIGQAQLSSLCRAVGISRLEGPPEVFFQKQLRVRLKITPAKDQYPAKNDVAGFEALGAPAPTAPRPAPAAPRPAAPAASASKPWMRA